MGTLLQMKNYLMDSMANLITGVGGLKDPRSGMSYTLNLLGRPELENAYRGDWLARRIVSAPAEDATREWRTWKAAPEQIEVLEEAERELNLRRVLRRGLDKARLYGGSAIVMGIANQGTSEQPIDVELVNEGDLKFVVVFHQFELNMGPRIKDINSEWFGRPEYYMLATGNVENLNDDKALAQGVRIHPSRVIPLVGHELPDDTLLTASNLWGDSVLQVVDEALKSAGMVVGSIATLISDAKMDVIKVPGLSKKLADEEGSRLFIARMSRANQLKSSISTLLIDGEEEWERIQTNFGAFPPLVEQYLRLSCGAAGIPMTRIFGDSAGGLGGSETGGAADLRNYYDDISSMQRNELSPTLTPLDHVFIRSVLGTYDENIYYEWTPLWQLSDTEKAEISAKKATTTKTYVDTGLINTDTMREAVVSQLQEDGVYPGLEEAIEKFGSEPDEPEIGEEDLAAHLGQMQKSASTLKSVANAAGVQQPPKKVADGLLFAEKQWWANDRSALERIPRFPHGGFVPGVALEDAEPRSLYVRRDVLNGQSIRKWAKARGFKVVMPANEMHVTVCYSRNKVDWMKFGSDDSWATTDEQPKMVVPAGGPRMLDMFGPEKDVVVLLFNSERIKWRHESFVREGASWDYPEYQPHITITMRKPEGMDIRKVEPYRGPIILGPEIFEEVKEGAMENVKES